MEIDAIVNVNTFPRLEVLESEHCILSVRVRWWRNASNDLIRLTNQPLRNPQPTEAKVPSLFTTTLSNPRAVHIHKRDETYPRLSMTRNLHILFRPYETFDHKGAYRYRGNEHAFGDKSRVVSQTKHHFSYNSADSSSYFISLSLYTNSSYCSVKP